jgi:hypothetical protein
VLVNILVGNHNIKKAIVTLFEGDVNLFTDINKKITQFMSIRLYKSYTPGTRNRALSTFSEITKTKPEKFNSKESS